MVACDALKEAIIIGAEEKVKIIIGGAPINNRFASSIGADGYALEAGSAVDLVKKLLAG